MKIKKYQLSNGKSYTVPEIAKVVNAPKHIIHARLCRSIEHERVFAPWTPRKNGRKSKNFQMRDTGEWVTWYDVVKRVGCSSSIARKRLNNFDTAEEVFAPKQDIMVRDNDNNKKHESYALRQIKKRGMFDNMLALAMRVI